MRNDVACNDLELIWANIFLAKTNIFLVHVTDHQIKIIFIAY